MTKYAMFKCSLELSLFSIKISQNWSDSTKSFLSSRDDNLRQVVTPISRETPATCSFLIDARVKVSEPEQNENCREERSPPVALDRPAVPLKSQRVRERERERGTCAERFPTRCHSRELQRCQRFSSKRWHCQRAAGTDESSASLLCFVTRVSPLSSSSF